MSWLNIIGFQGPDGGKRSVKSLPCGEGCRARPRAKPTLPLHVDRLRYGTPTLTSADRGYVRPNSREYGFRETHLILDWMAMALRFSRDWIFFMVSISS